MADNAQYGQVSQLLESEQKQYTEMVKTSLMQYNKADQNAKTKDLITVKELSQTEKALKRK